MAESGYLLIANGDAGAAERNVVGGAERVLADHAPVETVWTSSIDELDRALAGIDGRAAVVAGGDGSVHLLVNRLDHGRLLDCTSVGIVALGTGNDLVRGLGLPLDPIEAALRIVRGTPRPAPLLRLSNGEIVTNNAHLGLGVAAAERAAPLKAKLGRLAYTVGALLAGVSHDATDVAVELDGRTLHDGAAAVVFVALGPSAGGGHELADDVELLSDTVRVFVITANRLGARLRLLRHLATDGARNAPSVVSSRGSQVAITLRSETSAEIDGEFRSWSGTTTLTVEPNAWNVIR